MDETGGYAPRSPDLSAYHSGPAPPALQSPSQQQYQPPAFASYQPPASATQYNPPPTATAYHAPAAYQHPLGHPYPAQAMPQPPGAMSYAAAAPESEMQDAPEGAATAGRGRGRKSKKPKPEEHDDEGLPAAPGVVEGIEVKTKFPVARIKRIMQADEDVGKVAQVTPTAVSKALELFMISLVTKSAEQARSKSAKKVTAQHLKQVIQQDESFDFLTEIVSKIPDAPSSKKETKAEESDDGEPKKRRGRGKKKAEDEERWQ